VVLAGDARLPEKLRREDLMPLGSRSRFTFDAVDLQIYVDCHDASKNGCGSTIGIVALQSDS
jgi:hypothetical protein